MDSSIVYLVSIFFLISIVQESFILVLGDAGLIQSTCQRTRLPDICTSTLNADTSSQAADIKGLANIMINAGASSALDTSQYILDQVAQIYADVYKVVIDCSKAYYSAKTALQISLKDLSSDELDSAISKVAGGAKYPDFCRNSFSNATPPLPFPDQLAQRQATLQGLCGVAIDIIEVIRSSRP